MAAWSRNGCFTGVCWHSLRTIPGVVQVGTTNTVPLGGNGNDSVLIPEGYVLQKGESWISPKNIVVSPGYLEGMNLALRKGRATSPSGMRTKPSPR